MRWNLALWGRKRTRTGAADRLVRVEAIYNGMGALEVAPMPEHHWGVRRLPGAAAWAMQIGADGLTPLILEQVQVLNPTGGPLSLRLAMMTVSGGSPGVSNAFLAWDTLIEAGQVWEWSGSALLQDRWLYARGSAAGLVGYYMGRYMTP